MKSAGTSSSTPAINNGKSGVLQPLIKYLPLAVLVLSLILTLTLWNMYDKSLKHRAGEIFAEKAAVIYASVTERFHAHEQILRGAAGLFSVNEETSRADWRLYIASLQLEENHPGILGVGFSKWLTPAEKDAHINKTRKEGFPEYTIRPPGERPVYTSIVYLEPFNWRNQRAFGFDMYTEPMRRAAIDKARDTNTTTIAAKIILLQESEKEKQSGMLMYVPIYKHGMPLDNVEQRRAAFVGLVYSPIGMNDLVNGSSKTVDQDIAFDISVIGSKSADNLMFNSIKADNPKLPEDYQPDFTKSVTLQLHGCTWQFNFKTLPGFNKEYNRKQSFIFLSVSFLFSALLSGTTFIIMRQKNQALKQAVQHISELDRRLSLATSAAKIGIWDYDLQENKLIWDKCMFDLYGMQEEDFIGTDMAWQKSLHPDDFVAWYFAVHQATHGEKVFDIVFRVVWPTGEVRHIKADAIVLHDAGGKPLRIIGTNRDMTDQILADEAMLDAIKQAEAASRSKSEFLANMSHEIRTPMNAVMGMLYLLQRTALSPMQLDYAQKIQTASQTLLFLLNDILDFSKIEAGKLVLENHSFALSELLRNLSVILSSAVHDKDVEVLFSIDSTIPNALQGDSLRLQQVLLNLSSNAIKFTEQGEVVISVQTVAVTADRVELKFAVRDSGIGIAEDMLSNIFSGFVQAEASTTRRFGGTGLGLSISNQLVGMMGGVLAVESELGKGSTFYFTLSLERCLDAPIVERRKSPRESGASSGSPFTALIVDDNTIAREVLLSMVTSFGWEAESATSGAEAIDRINARASAGLSFDAIFMDWQMPGMDGVETTRQIRGLLHGDKVPVIILVTAHGRDYVAGHFADESSPLDGYLVKPVTPSMIYDAVRNVTSGRHALANMPTSAAVNSRRLAGLRLLVAEDNKLNQQIAEEILTAEGATVSLAASGSLAVKAINKEKPFDAVLMDIQMPDMDGYEATLHIRNVLGLKKLPIIAMTANAMQSDRERCLEVGMNDHVGKPFDVDSLIAILRKYCGLTQDESETEIAGTESERDADSQPTLNRPGFDCDAALKRLGNNRGLYARMSRAFEKDQGAIMEQLRQNLLPPPLPPRGRVREGDAANDLHTIKGVSAALGATALSLAAAEGETALRGSIDPAGATALFQEVERLFEEACIVLKDVADELEPPSARVEAAAGLESGEAITVLLELEALLNASNMKAMQRYYETKAGLEVSVGVGAKDLLPLLDEAMQRLDFAAAAELCSKMREGVV